MARRGDTEHPNEGVGLRPSRQSFGWGVPVNIAEASGKRSMNERRQFIDTAYGSSLECAACLDVLGILDCLSVQTVREGKDQLSTAALQAAAILDLVSLRQGKTKPLVAAGKSVLADIVRMLVAWQASLERK